MGFGHLLWLLGRDTAGCLAELPWCVLSQHCAIAAGGGYGCASFKIWLLMVDRLDEYPQNRLLMVGCGFKAQGLEYHDLAPLTPHLLLANRVYSANSFALRGIVFAVGYVRVDAPTAGLVTPRSPVVRPLHHCLAAVRTDACCMAAPVHGRTCPWPTHAQEPSAIGPRWAPSGCSATSSSPAYGV